MLLRTAVIVVHAYSMHSTPVAVVRELHAGAAKYCAQVYHSERLAPEKKLPPAILNAPLQVLQGSALPHSSAVTRDGRAHPALPSCQHFLQQPWQHPKPVQSAAAIATMIPTLTAWKY